MRIDRLISFIVRESEYVLLNKATIVSEINDWSIMVSFAQRDNTDVWVGEKTVLVLKARNR